MGLLYLFFFFFSSRRRHTSWPRDWSSDVCSSDLARTIVRGDPDACEELWWGKRLSGVTVRLARADHRRFADLLEDAWRRKAPQGLQLGAYEDGAPGSTGKVSTRRSPPGRARGGASSPRRGGPGR